MSRRWQVRLGAVLVRGASMEPALSDGDCLLVLRGGRVRAGAVVLARFHGRPALLVVKRAVEPAADGWLLASDNAAAPGAAAGPGDVEAVVLARYWPLPPSWYRHGTIRLRATLRRPPPPPGTPAPPWPARLRRPPEEQP